MEQQKRPAGRIGAGYGKRRFRTKTGEDTAAVTRTQTHRRCEGHPPRAVPWRIFRASRDQQDPSTASSWTTTLSAEPPAGSSMKRLQSTGVAAAVFLLGCWTVYLARIKEPSYQGRTLSQWLQTGDKGERLGPTSQHDYQVVTRTGSPIRSIGTNGIPTLLRLIQTHDSRLKRSCLSWLARHQSIKSRLLPDWEKQNMGVRGFGILGTNAISAIPALVQLTHNRNGDVQFTAGYVLFLVLGSLRHNKDVCMPVLQVLLDDSDRTIRLEAANTMAVWFPDEAGKAGVYQTFPQLKPPGTNNIPTNGQVLK